MSDYVQSLLSLPFGRVAELATEQLRYQQALVERQRNAVNNPLWLGALGGLGVAQYRPPYVRKLSDAELDARFAKLTIDLKAKRIQASQQEGNQG
jgi:hypothetical protein